ncbi:unnamed protein product [Paramecium primaurelia]|uniref:Kinesin motor domain-containing protein n=1 Tax=Paramecium primaurelia TaxID=5886 RepID=A0A8S1NJZ6_PARPR|nr:unnamed protein product [Paramecium primaurelia]
MSNQPFQVYLRIKPLLESCTETLIEDLNDNKIVIRKDGKNSKSFVFDKIFSGVQNNEDIFDQSLRHNLDHFVEGYNTTILAYGITGSGKSHTIFGNEKDEGLSFKCINYLVNRMKYMSPEANVQMEMSFIEVYNETIRDLMSDQPKPLMIMQDNQKGSYIQGLQAIKINSINDVKECINIANQNRSLAQTIYNVYSSRSHALIQFNLSYCFEGQTITPKLFIVDLAGSERVYQDQKSKNQQEGSNINRSLLALSNCLTILSDKTKKNQHIPYRNSKLTRLLQDSLGGNTRTIMISCIQQNKCQYDEILNTLQYSSRATQIKKQIQKSLHQQISEEKIIIHSNINDSEMSTKQLYLTKIYNDIYSNIEEYHEINNSLIEIQNNILQNQYQIEEIYSMSLQNNLNSINDDQMYHNLMIAQKQNQEIEQQLQNALKVNLKQKQLQKSLLLQITEEQQQYIDYWKIKYEESQKEIQELKQVLLTKNEDIQSKDSQIQSLQLLLDQIKTKNPSIYTTNNDSDCSYPSSFASSTSTSQIKKKSSLTHLNIQNTLSQQSQLFEMIDRPRFSNLSHIKQILASRERSPVNSIFRQSPIRSPLRKKPSIRNITSISKVEQSEISQISSIKKSRLINDPQITTINLYGSQYINLIDKENIS